MIQPLIYMILKLVKIGLFMIQEQLRDINHNYLILANNKNPGFIEFPEYEISF